MQVAILKPRVQFQLFELMEKAPSWAEELRFPPCSRNMSAALEAVTAWSCCTCQQERKPVSFIIVCLREPCLLNTSFHYLTAEWRDRWREGGSRQTWIIFVSRGHHAVHVRRFPAESKMIAVVVFIIISAICYTLEAFHCFCDFECWFDFSSFWFSLAVWVLALSIGSVFFALGYQLLWANVRHRSTSCFH